MKMRTFSERVDDVFRVVIHTEDWSQNDLLLMERYGEPEVDVGGTFDGTEEGSDSSGDPIDLLPDVTFTLSNKLYGIKTGTPFEYSFDLRDYADAEDRAILWRAIMWARITLAVTTLRDNDDTFTQEEVVTV